MAKAARKGKNMIRSKKIRAKTGAEKINAVLLEIFKAVTVTGNLAELLAIMRNKLGTIVDTRNFYVALYDKDTASYSFPYWVDAFDSEEDLEPEKLKKSLTDYVRRTGKAMLVDEELQQELVRRGEVEPIGAQSPIWLGVPLKTAKGIIGVLVVQSYDSETAYSQRDVDLLHLLADHIAMAIEQRKVEDELKMYREQLEELVSERTRELVLANKRLEEEIDNKRQSEILQSALYQISEKASAAEDMDTLYAAIHGIISSLLFARNFYIALIDAAGQIISFPYFADEFDPAIQPRKLRRGLSEYVLKTGQPLLVSERQIKQMAQEGLIELIGSLACEWLGVPLKRGDHTFGILVVQSYQDDFHYSEKDRELLIFVSQHIADALWRKQAERELRESQHFLQAVFNGIQDGISVLDRDLNILQVNQAMEKMYPQQVPLSGKKCFAAYHGRKTRCRICPTLRAINTKSPQTDEVSLADSDNRSGWLELHAFPLFDAEGQVTGVIEYVRDISDRKLLEQRFFQAQKMESIGLLAGGIAHDFNNILGGILGYASWLKASIKNDHPFYRPIDTIEKSANRAAELTAQLLAFARGGKYDIKPASLNGVIYESLKIINGTFDKSISVETLLDENLPTVEIDVGQIQQVLMNLCVNARDAMPGGGQLTIQSSLVNLSEYDVQNQLNVKPGWFAVMAVSDTGVGMDKSVKQRIFEPFFTTKEKGKGTGLGLSMVYGVVKNHGGFINVYSEVGKGSTFKVYLPLSGKPEILENSSDEKIPGGHESILVIDDEEVIRQVASDILGSYGFRVHLAADGEEGVRIYQKMAQQIDLVILDMIMPRLGGRETFLQLKKINSGVKVLFSTGYSQNEKVNEIIALGVRGFIQKPYQVNDLLEKVREVLDGKP